MCIYVTGQPYIPVPDTAEVKLVYNTLGGKALNVLNFKKSGGWDATSIAALATAASAAWSAHFSPGVSQDVSLDEVIATDLSSSSGVQSTLPAGISGSFLQPALPDNVTLATSFKTGLRGRSFRGRAFFVGLPKTVQVGDTISLSQATTYNGNWIAMIGAITAAVSGAAHVVVSRCQDGAWLTTGVATPVLHYATENTLDSSRRRLKGRGM